MNHDLEGLYEYQTAAGFYRTAKVQRRGDGYVIRWADGSTGERSADALQAMIDSGRLI